MQMSPLPPPQPVLPAVRESRLMEKAQALEQAFLSEMLSHAGLGRADDATGFGGGIGEEQFSSFLRQEQAGLLVRRGGIGLAEQLYRAMKGDAA